MPPWLLCEAFKHDCPSHWPISFHEKPRIGSQGRSVSVPIIPLISEIADSHFSRVTLQRYPAVNSKNNSGLLTNLCCELCFIVNEAVHKWWMWISKLIYSGEYGSCDCFYCMLIMEIWKISPILDSSVLTIWSNWEPKQNSGIKKNNNL